MRKEAGCVNTCPTHTLGKLGALSVAEDRVLPLAPHCHVTCKAGSWCVSIVLGCSVCTTSTLVT